MIHLRGHYDGNASALFWICVRTSLLSMITLGIYWFWGLVRIRRYFWAASALGQDRFRYTGTGLEKILGFIIALVSLSLFFGLLNLVLMFVYPDVFEEQGSPEGTLATSVFVIANALAFYFWINFAIYSAYRYKLTRTSWRGRHFGVEQGAFGYAFRALLLLFATIASLGLLAPLQTFFLRRYMVNRTWYGTAKFQQGGNWWALYPGLKHILFALLATFLAGFITAIGENAGLGLVEFLEIAARAILTFWLIAGVFYYYLYTFNYMTRQQTLDGIITFDINISLARIILIIFVGLLVLLGITLVYAALYVAIVDLTVGIEFAMQFIATINNPEEAIFVPRSFRFLPAITGFISLFILTIFYFIVVRGMLLVAINERIIAHIVQSITLVNAPHLNQIGGRGDELDTDGEGFATALGTDSIT